MRAIGRYLVLATISVLFSACGGNGNGKSQQVQPPDPPAAPVVTVDADIKQLIFGWDEVAGATYYRLLENPDGHSGFTQVGDNIPSFEVSVTRDIAVHLHDWVNALYLVQACNAGGCAGSTEVSATDVMLDTIGYFKVSNTDFDDRFGGSVGLSADGNTLVVGARTEGSSATGINGDQADNSARDSGAVYLFRFDGTDWIQKAYIKASNTDVSDQFGGSVALSADGNTLAVGAGGEDSGATGVNGDQTDNSAYGAGAVYVFRLVDESWSQQAYIKASNTEVGDFFGETLALSADGDTLALGAPREDSRATGINGDQYDDYHTYHCDGDSGAVYVFRFDGANWFQQAYVKASNTGVGEEYDPAEPRVDCREGDHFGTDVSLSNDGDTLAVGAPLEDGLSTGVNGDQSNEGYIYYDSGAAYVFAFDGSSWSQQAYIKPSALPPIPPPWVKYYFGERIALDAAGIVLAVSAPQDSNIAPGRVNEPPVSLNEQAPGSGAVYLLRSDGNAWSHDSYFKASNAEIWDYMGSRIALSADGNTLAVGADGEDSSARGIGGGESDNSANDSGAVYVFQFDGTSWSQPAFVKSSNSEAEDGFGGGIGWYFFRYDKPLSLSADGTIMAVGAPGEDSGAIGINGDQNDNSAENSGAVYVY